MCATVHLDEVAVGVQVVVDRVGVGDEVPLVLAQVSIDGRLVVLGRGPEQDVPRGRDHDPEGPPAAALERLQQHSGGVGAQIRSVQSFLPQRYSSQLHKSRVI